MSTAAILERIRQETTQLVSERLRSTAVAIARLEHLITRANKLGHAHVSIHQAIRAGGLHTSLNNYKVYLHRARKSGIGSHLPSISIDQSPGPSDREAPADETPDRLLDTPDNEAPSLRPDAVSHTRDSLQLAKQTASRDYSRIAKSHLRKPHK